jgi:hypothetical protein
MHPLTINLSSTIFCVFPVLACFCVFLIMDIMYQISYEWWCTSWGCLGRFCSLNLSPKLNILFQGSWWLDHTLFLITVSSHASCQWKHTNEWHFHLELGVFFPTPFYSHSWLNEMPSFNNFMMFFQAEFQSDICKVVHRNALCSGPFKRMLLFFGLDLEGKDILLWIIIECIVTSMDFGPEKLGEMIDPNLVVQGFTFMFWHFVSNTTFLNVHPTPSFQKVQQKWKII